MTKIVLIAACILVVACIVACRVYMKKWYPVVVIPSGRFEEFYRINIQDGYDHYPTYKLLQMEKYKDGNGHDFMRLWLKRIDWENLF